MKLPFRGAVDCDIHPAAPPMSALLPYMTDYWSDQLHNRHVDRMGFTMTSNNPLLSLFSGVHDVRVIADASAQSGTATVVAQSVEIDGIPVPRMALEYFVNKYLTSRFPNVGMTSRFKLPSKVDSATVGQAQVTVNQR